MLYLSQEKGKEIKTMKKLIAIALILITLATIGCTTIKTTKENLYPRMAIVVEIDRENDIVTFEDYVGFRWEMYGCEDWEIEDIGALLMNDKGTDYILDDEIVQALYNGYLGCGWED
jgi:hypothetical protein